jgi:uncharacterized protein YegL
MKKILLGLGAIAAVLVVMPMFAAFEAHVVNVTATIENALTVPTEHISFGTVFPQEHLDKPLEVKLSTSFIAEDRVDDVDYFIRQKPKCGITTLDGRTLVEGSTKTGHIIVNTATTDDLTDYTIDCGTRPEVPNFVFDEQTHKYGVLPMLCPYISKHPDGTPTNDGSLNSFHKPFEVINNGIKWNDTAGHLAKSQQDTVDNWTIDLAVPCFGGQCAQDWLSFVRRISGNAEMTQQEADQYTQPTDNEHKVFGCDLWVEVGGISLPGLGCKGKIDLMLVVDRSGSIGSTNMASVRTALNSFVDALMLSQDGSNAGQSSFASVGTLDQVLTDNPTLVKNAVDALISGGSTNLTAGINLAQTELQSVRDRLDAPNFMIVVTDGVPNVGSDPTAEAAAAAAAARANGTEIYVVGVGDGVNADYLRDQIASPIGASHYFAGDFSTLQTTMVDIVSCESSG